MRLFVAAYPSPEALDHFAAEVARLRLGAAAAAGGRVGLTDRARWHVTLAFIGELADAHVPAAEEALRSGAAQWRTHAAAPPRLRLAGGGRFGRRRFTVLWVGLDGEVDALRSLGGALRRELRRSAVEHDRKPLRPHLTFARPGERLPAEELAADLEMLDGYEGPGWTLDAVHLVRSRPGPNPVHEALATVPL